MWSLNYWLYKVKRKKYGKKMNYNVLLMNKFIVIGFFCLFGVVGVVVGFIVCFDFLFLLEGLFDVILVNMEMRL